MHHRASGVHRERPACAAALQPTSQKLPCRHRAELDGRHPEPEATKRQAAPLEIFTVRSKGQEGREEADLGV
jgi:hypothetical protein